MRLPQTVLARLDVHLAGVGLSLSFYASTQSIQVSPDPRNPQHAGMLLEAIVAPLKEHIDLCSRAGLGMSLRQLIQGTVQMPQQSPEPSIAVQILCYGPVREPLTSGGWSRPGAGSQCRGPSWRRACGPRSTRTCPQARNGPRGWTRRDSPHPSCTARRDRVSTRTGSAAEGGSASRGSACCSCLHITVVQAPLYICRFPTKLSLLFWSSVCGRRRELT